MMRHLPRLLSLLVLACVSIVFLKADRTDKTDTSHSLDSRISYKLQPMDLLKVQVYQEPELDREVRVSRGRTIVLPLIGTVDVKSRTLNETEQLIVDLYNRDYLV